MILTAKTITEINTIRKFRQILTFEFELIICILRMKLFVISMLFLMPCFAFGQLFPKLPDFRGNIEKVTEKRYGKALNQDKKDSAVFKPRKYSGRKYTYQFDENSKLKSRSDIFQNKVLTEYTYQRNNQGGRIMEREIVEKDNDGRAGDYVEYENFIDSVGQITKVNYWAFDHRKNARELFMIEMNAEYKQGKLMSFTSHPVNEKGDIDTGEKCELFYDSAGRLIRIDRIDLESNLKTELLYTLEANGFLDHYSIDFLVGLPIYGKNPKQDIYYKCDSHGNWVKKYRITNKKKIIEARRTIKYQ